MGEWADGYKDPRWQKKRLEVMERDEWACVACADSKSTLQVHHGYYRKGAKGPWDYDPESLWTLCGKCHEGITKDMRFLHMMIGHVQPRLVCKVIDCLIAHFEARQIHIDEYGEDPTKLVLAVDAEDSTKFVFKADAEQGETDA